MLTTHVSKSGPKYHKDETWPASFMIGSIPVEKRFIFLVPTRMSFNIATLYKNMSCCIWSFIAKHDFDIWLTMAHIYHLNAAFYNNIRVGGIVCHS